MSFMRLTFGDISALAAVGGVLLVPLVIGGAAGSALEGVAGAGTNEADVIRAGELGSSPGRGQISAGAGSERRATRPDGARGQTDSGARSTIAPAGAPRGKRAVPVDSSSEGAPSRASVSPTPSSPAGPSVSPSPPTAPAAVPPPPQLSIPPPLISLPPPLPPTTAPPPPPPPLNLPNLPPAPPVLPLAPPPPLPPIEPLTLPSLPLP
jgi:hypothetical protein